MNTRIILGSFFALGVAVPMSAQQQPSYPTPTAQLQIAPAPSTGDSAPHKKAKHVYTNDDFHHPDPVNPAALTNADISSTSNDAAGKDTPLADSNKQVKTVPQPTEEIQMKIDTEKQNLDTLQALFEKTENEITNPKTPEFRRQMLLEQERGIRKSIRDVQDRKTQADQDLAAAQKNKDQKPVEKPADKPTTPPPPKS